MQVTAPPHVAASTVWTNPSRALTDNASYATHPTGATNGWLRLYDFQFSLGAATAYEIVGVLVKIYPADLPIIGTTPGLTPRLEVALSIDGGLTVSGTSKFVNYDPGFGVTFNLGGVSDPWGNTFTKAEIQSSSFAVMIRRGDVMGSEDTSQVREIDALEATIYYNLAGSSFTMSERITGNQRHIFRRDVASGSNTNQWWWASRSHVQLASKPEYQDIALQGSFVGDGHVKTYEASDGSLVVPDSVDANEAGLWITCRHGLPATTLLATGVYQHEWHIDPLVRPTPVLLEGQEGAIDDSVSEQFRQICLRQIGIQATKRSVQLSGSAFAQAVVEQGTKLSGGANEQQTITVSGSPTTLTLKYKGAETSAVAGNAAAAAWQTALQALSTVGPGNILVTGSAGGPYTATGAGAFAGIELELIEKGTLVGGTAPDVVIARSTAGGWKTFPTAPLIGGQLNCYLADAIADLAANKIVDLHAFSFDSGDGFDPQDKMNTADGLTYSVVVPKPFQSLCKLTMQADGYGQTVAGYSRSRTFKWMRAKFVSDQIIGSAIPYSLEYELYGQFKDAGDRKAAGQIVARDFDFNIKRDATTGKAGTIRLVNAVASYAV